MAPADAGRSRRRAPLIVQRPADGGSFNTDDLAFGLTRLWKETPELHGSTRQCPPFSFAPKRP